VRAVDPSGSWVDAQFKVTVAGTDSSIPPVVPDEPNKTPPALPPTVSPVESPGGDNSSLPPKGEEPPLGLNSGSGITTDSSTAIGSDTGIQFSTDDLTYGAAENKSSRDYARLEESLNAAKSPLTLLTASTSLVSLIAPDAGFSPWEAEDFDNEVRRIRAQMDEAMDEETQRKTLIAGLTFSVTTGLLVWSLRASSLLLTMMSMLPLWRGIDPLPILDEVDKKRKMLEQQRKDREREDKSAKEVGYLFDHAQRKKTHR
jgi:hypothetical protein